MATLRSQFDQALKMIEINQDKARRAIKAHTEVRDVLEKEERLTEWGVDTKLIGSYSRDTGIYPGKDVDVFVKLTKLDTTSEPKVVYNAVWDALQKEYGDSRTGGLAEQQTRSVKVSFPNRKDAKSSFAVDAVPAVQDGEHWAIPTRDRNRWAASTGRWVTTDPERFGEMSSALSTSYLSPTVGERNAFKPIVKLMRQARRTHLGDRRPGGLFIEFATYELWDLGSLTGDEWDPLLAQTLRGVSERLADAVIRPLCDPALGTPVEPPVQLEDLINAAAVFLELANLADQAVNSGACQAALGWRKILGSNDRADPVFPLPPGCDSSGKRAAPIVAGNEARRFG